MMKTVTIVGLGYVGLPLACLCAEKGHKVYGLDIDKSKTDLVNKQISPVDDDYISNKLNLAVGITKNSQVMSGPLDAVKANCEKYFVLQQGSEKSSSVAKYLQHKINASIDEIIRALPSGGFQVKKE